MATIISSTTAEVNLSTAFSMSGPGKLIASGLAGNEYAKLYEEFPDGVYRPANDKAGVGIVLTAIESSILVEGYGNYKMYKTATAAAAIVDYNS